MSTEQYSSIAVVMLQADHYLFSTIMTDTRLTEMSQEFSLVLTRDQSDRLDAELTVVFWSAFFWMMVGYISLVNLTVPTMAQPDRPFILQAVLIISVLGFSLTTDLVVELWCTCRKISKARDISIRQLATHFGVTAIRKIVSFVCYMIAQIALDVVFNFRRSELQSTQGDIQYDLPHHIPGYLIWGYE